MYDLQLTVEQREFRDTVRHFVMREIKPVVLHPDRLQDPRRPFPIQLVDMAAQMGLRTLALAEAAGGAGADQLTCCIVLEELAAGDAGIAVTLAHTSLLGHLLFDQMMTMAQRERFLPRFVTGDRHHLAIVHGEPNAELDWSYHRPRDDTGGEMTAVRSGDGWIVNGTARFVTNAPFAELFAIRVRTNGVGSTVNTLLAPRATPGLTVSDVVDEVDGRPAVKWFHGAAGKLVLNECRIPADNLLAGNTAIALRRDGEFMQRDMLQGAAINLGIGRAAYEGAVEYTKLRRQGGRQIVEHQAIGTMLADMAIKLEAARNMVWKAAWRLDQPDAGIEHGVPDLPLAVMAKIFVSETVHEVTETAAECFGAMGVMLDMPLPKYVHDALVFIHSGISNSVAKFKVAEAVAGYRRTGPDKI